MVLFCPVFFVCTRIPHGAIQIYHFQMDDTNMLNAVSGASVMCSSNITEIHCDTLVQCHPTRPMKPRFNAMRSHWHLRRLGYGEREFVSRALCLLARLTNSRSPLCLLHEHISTSALHCNALIRYGIVQFNGLVCFRARVYKWWDRVFDTQQHSSKRMRCLQDNLFM